MILLTIVGIIALLLLGLIAREIHYAANPDKRPIKRKKRK
jgi:hypothetical protein